MAKVTTPAIVVTAAIIDELAMLREQIASLAKREKELVKAVREDCNGVDTITVASITCSKPVTSPRSVWIRSPLVRRWAKSGARRTPRPAWR